MQDRVHAVGFDHLGKTRGIADVPFFERRVYRLRGGTVAGREVVVDHDIRARGAQRLDGVAADVARTAGHEHAHLRPIER